jgi:purine-binding chemotaxis protein CheW
MRALLASGALMSKELVRQTREFSDQGHEEQFQYLIFRLKDESFGISILKVKEIIQYNVATSVPMMPAFVHGVINLRGRVVPVIDLSLRFSQLPTEVGRRTCVIIVELQQEDPVQDIGIIVDGVNQVIELPPDAIGPAPAFGAKLPAEFIAGMGLLEGQFVMLLNLDRTLSLAEMGQKARENIPVLAYASH